MSGAIPFPDGGFEDMQVLAFDGSLDRILRGESDPDGNVDALAALKEGMNAAAIQTLLRKGEILIIKEGEIFRQGVPESLSADAEVRRIYLGETFNLN